MEKKLEDFQKPIYAPGVAEILGKKTAVECAKLVILENKVNDTVFCYASLRNRYIITCRINGVNPGNIERNIRKAVELLSKAGKIMRYERNKWKVVV